MKSPRKIEPDPFFTDLAAALREPQRLAAVPEAAADPLVNAADRHGVAAVLFHQAAAAGVPACGATDLLRVRVSGQAATAILRDQEAVRMLACLTRAGIPHIVLKGLALAYTAYPKPWMRPRSDTDILVHEADVPKVDDVFLAEGYRLLPHVRGEVTLPQRHYYKSDARGAPQHNWDIHWRLTSSHVLADTPPIRELWAEARHVDSLGGAAIPAPPHALLIACIHRLAHHYDDSRLIWLWDIRLLLEAMSSEEVALFGQLGGQNARSASACGRSLSIARDLCGACVPPALEPLLEAATADSGAAFLWSGSPRRVTYLIGELRAMPSRTRLRALREHLFPSASSMRERYPSAPRALLPLLYPWRLMLGVPKWLSGR